jgi:hypothetical protein
MAVTSNMKVYGMEQPEEHLPESRSKGPQSEQLPSPTSQTRFPQQLSCMVLVHTEELQTSVVQEFPSLQSESTVQVCVGTER